MRCLIFFCCFGYAAGIVGAAVLVAVGKLAGKTGRRSLKACGYRLSTLNPQLLTRL